MKIIFVQVVTVILGSTFFSAHIASGDPTTCHTSCVDQDCYRTIAPATGAVERYWKVTSGTCRHYLRDAVDTGRTCGGGSLPGQNIEEVDGGDTTCGSSPDNNPSAKYAINCGEPTGKTGKRDCCVACVVREY